MQVAISGVAPASARHPVGRCHLCGGAERLGETIDRHRQVARVLRAEQLRGPSTSLAGPRRSELALEALEVAVYDRLDQADERLRRRAVDAVLARHRTQGDPITAPGRGGGVEHLALGVGRVH
jgi:hypothetical protein